MSVQSLGSVSTSTPWYNVHGSSAPSGPRPTSSRSLLQGGAPASLSPFEFPETPAPPPTTTDSHTEIRTQEILDGGTQAPSAGAMAQDRWSMVASMRDQGGHQGHEMEHAHAHNQEERVPARRSSKFPWNVPLDAAGHYQLNWNPDYHANRISFALEINTNKSGFRPGSDIFALGFSERGQLESSDFCLVWFDLSHGLHMQDAHTDASNLLHLVDPAKSVCRLINAGRNAKQHSWSPRDSNPDLEEIDEEEEEAAERARQANQLQASRSSYFEVQFRRSLEVCSGGGGGVGSHGGTGSRRDYYAIGNGTTHLVWWALKGPVLALDGLNLTELATTRTTTTTTTTTTTANQEDQHANSGGGGTGHKSSNFEFGLRRVQLIAAGAPGAAAAAADSVDAMHASTRRLDIRMDKFAVPARETTYWCKLFKLPERFERRRFHMISYEAAIEPVGAMEHVVHHMELFNCANLSPRERAELEALHASPSGAWSGECGAPTRPRATQSCKRVILAWAMGAKPLVYPDQVGQSIGGPHYSPFVVLEVHYNNVGRARNLLDSSGLRFHYTPRLRPYDAGILEVGLEYSDKNSIPPGLVTPLVGHCVGACTRVAMSQPPALMRHNGNSQQQSGASMHSHHRHQQPEVQDDNSTTTTVTTTATTGSQPTPQQQQQQTMAANDGSIYIFAGQMHTHLAGVASWTELVREGRRLGEIQRDDHYSPHFQEIRLLPRHVRVAPGDALVHYCLYDTRHRPNITLGGFATADEMCVTYLHYYPRIDLEVCKSSVDDSALASYFARMARDDHRGTAQDAAAAAAAPEAHHDDQNNKATVSENYRSIEWTPRRARELIEFYARAPLSVQCNRSDGARWPGPWRGHEPTRILRAEAGAAQVDDSQAAAAAAADDSFDYYETPSARELLAYRGLGHRARHPRCQAAAPGGK